MDYAFVIRTSEDLAGWGAAYEWCAAGSQPLHTYQDVPMGTFDWTERVLLAGDVVLLNRLDDLPRGNRHPQAIRVLGIQVCTPGAHAGAGRPRISGCITIQFTRAGDNLAAGRCRAARLVGDAIATAIERTRVAKNSAKARLDFGRLFEQAPVGILNVAPDGRLLKANQRFCEMLGYSSEEILGRHYSEFTHQDDLRATTVLYDSLLGKSRFGPFLEKRYLRKTARSCGET